MPDRVVQIKFKGDEKDVLASITRLEAAAKRLDTVFSRVGIQSKSGGDASNSILQSEIRAQKDLLALQAAQERAEVANQRAKQATLAVAREEIKLLQDKLRLETQSAKAKPLSAALNTSANSPITISRGNPEDNGGVLNQMRAEEQAAFARQVALTKAYEAQQNQERETTSVVIKETKKRTEAETAALNEMRLYEKRSVESSIEANAVLAESAKVLADVKIREARRANIESINQVKQFEAEQKRIQNEQKQQAQNESSAVKSSFIGSLAGNIGAYAVVSLTSSLQQGASALLSYSAKLEQARIGFTTLTGSVEAADAHIRDLQNFAKTTPFDFDKVAQASQLLQGMGVNAQKVVPILTDVGNRLAAAGKGNEEFQRVVLELSQVAAKGNLAGDAIRSLAKNGVPAVEILAQATGKSKAEIVDLSKKGQIGFDLLVAAIHKVNEQNHLGDAMEKQSHTFNGAVENIKDSLYQLADKAFKPLFNKFSHIADELAQEATKQDADFHTIGSAMGKAIGEAMVAAIGEAVKGIRTEFGKEIDDLINDIKNGKGLSNTSTPVGAGASISEYLFGKSSSSPTANSGIGNGIGKLIGNYNGQIAADAQTKRLLEKISRDENGAYGSVSELASRTLGLNIAGVTTEVKKLNNEADKLPPLLGGKSKGTGGKDYLNASQLSDFAKTLGFTVTSTTGGEHNAGSLHYKGLAADIRTRDKSPAQIAYFIEEAKKAGIYVSDERTRPAGQKVYSGSHLHIEDARLHKGVNRDADSFTEFEKQFNEKQARDISDASDAETKKRRDDFITQAIAVYKATGLIPTDDLLNAFQEKYAAEAKKGNSVFGLKAGVQPTAQDVTNFFRANASNKAEGLTTTPGGAGIGTQELIPHLSEDQKYLDDIVKSLNVAAIDAERHFRDSNYEAETSLKLQAQIAQQKLDLQKAGQDYDIQARQNSDAEFVSERQQLAALTEINALNAEYARMQDEEVNAGNKELTIDRERNRLQSERNDLIRSIQDLQGQIQNGAANDPLKIEEAHLQDILNLRNKELDAVIAVNKAQLDLSHSLDVSNNQIRAGVLTHLAQQRTLSESIADGINKTYDSLQGKFDAFVDKSTKKLGVFAGLISEPIKAIGHKIESNITSGLLNTLFPGQNLGAALQSTGNPVVDKITESNTHLKNIEDALTGRVNFTSSGGGGSTAGGGGFSIGNLLNSLFHGGRNSSGGGTAGGGINLGSLFGGSAGGGVFNFAGGGSSSSSSGGGGGLLLTPDGLQIPKELLNGGHSNSGVGIGSLLGNPGGTNSPNGILSSLFGKGGIFGSQGFGLNTGTAQGLGGLGILAGGLISSAFGGSPIGRRVGGLLTGAGTGASIGAIGGPIGAALGAFVGGIIGLFTSGGQRNRDEQARTQYLNDAKASLSGFDSIIRDLKGLRIDSATAIAKGTDLGTQIRTNYLAQANALKDDKTRRIAVSAVSEIDFLIGQKMQALRAAADGSDAAADRKNRILPEFASGGFMDAGFVKQFKNFKRRNGLLQGTFTGADTLPAMLAPGEMVLNPEQQTRAIQAAGFDVFRHAKIPNYADGTYVSLPQPVTVNRSVSNSSNAQQPITINVVVEGEIDAARIKNVSIDSLDTEQARRQLKVTLGKLQTNKGRP